MRSGILQEGLIAHWQRNVYNRIGSKSSIMHEDNMSVYAAVDGFCSKLQQLCITCNSNNSSWSMHFILHFHMLENTRPFISRFLVPQVNHTDKSCLNYRYMFIPIHLTVIERWKTISTHDVFTQNRCRLTQLGRWTCSLIIPYLPKGVLSVPASFKARAMFHAVVEVYKTEDLLQCLTWSTMKLVNGV